MDPQGLYYYGVVDSIPGANQFTVDALAGGGDSAFADALQPYRVFVMHDAGNAGAAPQGQQQTITAYVSATGTFTTDAFSPSAIGVGDTVLIMHPSIATPGYDMDGVYINSTIGVAGTEWPVGTPGIPVSNITDALAIATARKLSSLYFLNAATYTLPDGIYMLRLSGGARFGSAATIALNGKDITNCVFSGLRVSGIAAGADYATFIDCYIQNNAQIYGEFYGCVFAANMIALGDDNFYNCTFGEQAYAYGTTLNQNGKNNLIFNCNGRLILANLDYGVTYIYGESLNCTIDNTNDNGEIYIWGGVKITNQETGAGLLFSDFTDKPKPEVAVNITATNAGETNFLNLATAGFHYTIDDLVLKCADPGANTVYVKVYRLVNGVLTAINVSAASPNGFEITTSNYTYNFTLMDLYGITHLAGDNLKITVRASAGGPYTVTGSYAYRSA